MNTTNPAEGVLNAADANHDLRQYARHMRSGSHAGAAAIEQKWSLYGYTPEIVSTVLSCVATGLSFEAAVDEATS